jgi:hypothetical protein
MPSSDDGPTTPARVETSSCVPDTTDSSREARFFAARPGWSGAREPSPDDLRLSPQRRSDAHRRRGSLFDAPT